MGGRTPAPRRRIAVAYCTAHIVCRHGPHTGCISVSVHARSGRSEYRGVLQQILDGQRRVFVEMVAFEKPL